MTIAYFWRTYQWSKQREEIEELNSEIDLIRCELSDHKKSFDALYEDFQQRAKKTYGLERTCEQLTLDLAIVRGEAEERAKELDTYKEQHERAERRAILWEQHFYAIKRRVIDAVEMVE
jgi:chromosome segregation ATPase